MPLDATEIAVDLPAAIGLYFQITAAVKGMPAGPRNAEVYVRALGAAEGSILLKTAQLFDQVEAQAKT
jgi:hypothetical protein